jgi:DNA-directed RNA polymerase subunit N (RpoN/RPB10)
MLYITCPTCGYFLGQKTLEYEQEKNKVCSDPNMSPEQRELALSKILLNLKLRRYCCKMRFMTYKDLVYDILPAQSNE